MKLLKIYNKRVFIDAYENEFPQSKIIFDFIKTNCETRYSLQVLALYIPKNKKIEEIWNEMICA